MCLVPLAFQILKQGANISSNGGEIVIYMKRHWPQFKGHDLYLTNYLSQRERASDAINT